MTPEIIKETVSRVRFSYVFPKHVADLPLFRLPSFLFFPLSFHLYPKRNNHRRDTLRPKLFRALLQVFQNFTELRGDGRVGADGCIRGGLACLKSDPSVRCVVIASFKGHTPGDMQAANYGMSSPAGYRKALRLMRIAERFGLPVITLVDTCGALPSFSAERDGQSEAIATNLTTMAGLRVPIVTIVAGEGGSGGALGIGMGNVVGMLSTAYYGVISPEGAASILGRYKSDADKAERFPKDCRALADMQKIYAPQLKELPQRSRQCQWIATPAAGSCTPREGRSRSPEPAEAARAERHTAPGPVSALAGRPAGSALGPPPALNWPWYQHACMRAKAHCMASDEKSGMVRLSLRRKGS